jgi:hypothetical protein
MALGEVVQPALILDQLRGSSGDSINYERRGEATAKALRKNPPVTRWPDFKAVESRAGFTDMVLNG